MVVQRMGGRAAVWSVDGDRCRDVNISRRFAPHLPHGVATIAVSPIRGVTPVSDWAGGGVGCLMWR